MQVLRFTTSLFLFFTVSLPSFACTTAVISGRVTVDGRPLLWKNRDAPQRDNQVVFLSKGKLRAIAVVNAGKRESVWMGVNESGFCIENSLCRDLTEADAKGPGNGNLMLRALQNCQSVADFEKLLEETNGRRSTNATYGVIDRDGGAMMFEVSPSKFARWDANNPVDAPNGFVVRSNFAYLDQGKRTMSREEIAKISSGDRYLRAEELLRQALADGKISTRYILQHCSRDLADANGKPICGSVNGEIGELPELINTASTISRRTSVSAAVFHGVLAGEDPTQTTMWIMLGEPNFSIAIPCWVHAGDVGQPLIGDGKSPLCSAIRKLRQLNYIQPNQDGAEWLKGANMQAIWKKTIETESSQLNRIAEARFGWSRRSPSSAELLQLHTQAIEQASQCIEELLSMESAKR